MTYNVSSGTLNPTIPTLSTHRCGRQHCLMCMSVHMKLQEEQEEDQQPRRKRRRSDEDYDQSNVAVGDGMVGVNFEVKSDHVAGPHGPVSDQDEDGTRQEVDDGESRYFHDDTSNPMSRSTENKQRGSPVWKYFIPRDGCAVCKLCSKSAKRSGGNTSNLMQHLKRAHHRQYLRMMNICNSRNMESATRAMVR